MRPTDLAVLTTALLSITSFALTGPDQTFFGKPTQHGEGEWTTFARPIRKVAVIGAGPSGLQHAAALIKDGFSVHLIDRSDAPGGNWHHNVLTPVREAYPNLPLDIGAFIPDARDNATVKFYEEGDEGLSLDERWREHSRPAPIWDDLTTNSAPVFTTLPGVSYPEDATWELPGYLVQRHVRSYASSQGLNVGDEHYNASAPVFLRYSTRLELLEKEGHSWKLSLRSLTRLPENKRIKAEWTVELFDAVVVASGGYDAPYVPPTKGLVGWSKVNKNGHYPLHHSQSYRNPNPYQGKTVLIIGASVSASEISRRIGPHVEKLYISIRNTTRSTYMQRRSIRRLSPFAEIIPEVIEYGHLDAEHELAGGSITVANGTSISGIDEVILATGFLRSMPFLKEYRSIGGQATSDRPPIVTNGHTLSALAWTGHYIADPTLAFATVRPWTLGRYQALGFAKVWTGTARLPSQSRLWDDYHNNNHWGGGSKVVFGTLEEESLGRQWVAWLNHESLIHGGRLVDQWPIEWRERFVYYAEQAWEAGYTTSRNFTEYENTPRADWPTYPIPHDALLEAESAEFVDGVSEW